MPKTFWSKGFTLASVVLLGLVVVVCNTAVNVSVRWEGPVLTAQVTEILLGVSVALLVLALVSELFLAGKRRMPASSGD